MTHEIFKLLSYYNISHAKLLDIIGLHQRAHTCNNKYIQEYIDKGE